MHYIGMQKQEIITCKIMIELSDIQYLDANNLRGWAMTQKFPVDGFK